jgi:hypothetical protein
MTREETIWLAAIIDGEGCIFIARPSPSRPTFVLELGVYNTHRGLIDRVLEVASLGSVCARKRDKWHRRTIHQWKVGGEGARSILSLVLPHLIAKHEEAELALATDLRGDQADAAYWKLRDLKGGLRS